MATQPLEYRKCKDLDLGNRKKTQEQEAEGVKSKTIEVFSPYCIVNKTNLELEFFDKKTSILSPPHSVAFFKSNRIKVKITKEEYGEPSEVSKDFNISAVGVSGCISLPFKKIIDDMPQEIILGVCVFSATPPLVKTKIVYLTARFMIKNDLGIPIYIRQYLKEGPGILIKKIEDGENIPYNLENSDISRLVQISKDGEKWSSTFSIQNIEDFQIKFQASAEDKPKAPSETEWHQPSVINGFHYIVRVIVTTEDQATIHTILTIPKDPEFSINNTTISEVTIKQHKFPELLVPEHSIVPWAFDDLSADKTLEINIDGKTKEINIEKVKKSKKFGKYRIEVRVVGVTRELKITLTRGSIDSEIDIDEKSRVLWKVDIHFRGIGISIIDSKPSELFYFSAIEINNKIKLREKRSNKKIEHRTKFRLGIGKIQIDNMQAKGKLFPVIFGPSSKGGDENIPMVQFEVDKTAYKTLIKDSTYESSSTDRFSWVELGLQELRLSLNQEIIASLLDLSQEIMKKLFLDSTFKPFPPKPVPMSAICPSLDASLSKLTVSPTQNATRTYFKLVHLGAVKILVSFKVGNKSFEININPREGFGLMQLLGVVGGAFVNISDSPLYFKEVLIQESFQTVYTLA